MSGFGLHNSAASPNTMQAANAINGVNNTLNNVAWVMLSKIKSPEELEALRQHANAYGAAARLHNAQADAAAAAATEAANAPTVFTQNVSGMTKPQYDAYQGYKTTGSWGMTDAVDDPEKQMTIAPRAKTAADYNISPEMISAANSAAAEMAGKGRGQAHVAEALKAGVLQPAALGQTVDPAKLQNFATTAYATGESKNPVYHVDGHGAVTNMLTGMVDTNNPMARSYIGVNNASANQHNAAAANSNAQARYHGALANGAEINNMPSAVVSDDGRTFMVTSDKAADLARKQDSTTATNASREKVGAGHDAAKTGGAGVGKDFSESEKKTFRQALGGIITPTGLSGEDLPAGVMNAIYATTLDIYHDPKSEFRGNLTAATQAAIDKLTGGKGIEASGIYGMRKVMPKGGGQWAVEMPEKPVTPTGVSATMAGAVPPVGKKGPSIQTPPPPAVGTVKGGYRFKGGNPADQNNWEPAEG